MIDAPNDRESAETPEGDATPSAVELRRAREKEALLRSVADARLNTLQTRVAWLLNHLPETRDSDITLQLRYWEQFEPEIYRGGLVSPEDLYRLTRLTSITRARATIQNTHGLFLASEEVRKHRGTLEEEEKETARGAAASVRKSFSIYSDESGKTSDNLIVGTVWLLNGIESRAITQATDAWRQHHKFESELHFAEIGRPTIERYLEAVDILHRHSAALSFKAIVLPRRGLTDQSRALDDMLYHLIVRGIAHEEKNGRATLPRTLQLWKDAENEAADRLMLANLSDRLKQAAVSSFSGELFVGEMFAQDSKTNILLQFADLFVSSVNRTLSNPASESDHPKDVFAQRLLSKFKVRQNADKLESGGDVTVFEDV